MLLLRMLLLQPPSAAAAERSGSEGRNGDKMQPKNSLTCRLKPSKNCANDDLNFSDLFSQLNGLADAELDRLDLDADQYSSFMDQLQALNDLGLNTVAVEGVLGSVALSSFGLSRTGVSMSDISSLLGLLVDGGGFLANLNVLAIALRQARKPKHLKSEQIILALPQALLETCLYASALLRSFRRSALEAQGFPNGRNPFGPLGMLGDDGGEPGESREPFSTEAAFQLLDALQFLQSEAVPALLSLEAASVAGLTEGLPLEPVLRDIQSFVSRITNTTREEIETSVVPSLLNGSLSTGICGSQVAPAVGQLIARTHERCPFYRAVVPQLARGSLTSGLLETQSCHVQVLTDPASSTVKILRVLGQELPRILHKERTFLKFSQTFCRQSMLDRPDLSNLEDIRTEY
eukprot:s4747_g3.t1